MRTDHFTVSFYGPMASGLEALLTVLNVPEPEPYAAATGLPIGWLPDQEAVARHIAIQLVAPQGITPYGVHAQRIYR